MRVIMAMNPEQLKTLRALCKCKNKDKQQELLYTGGPNLQHALREVSHNVLKGTVPLTKAQKKHLKKHASDVRALAKKSTSLKKRLTIEQKGGFLPLLLAPLFGSVLQGAIQGLTAAGRR